LVISQIALIIIPQKSRDNAIVLGPFCLFIIFIYPFVRRITREVVDLGVTIDCNLKYSMHIDNIVGRARQRVGLLFKWFVTRDADTLLRAFKVYIRPILEYASNIWSPTQIGLIDKLESVQRRFTKRIPDFEILSYSERLSLMDLA